jgi:hypothetical protein
MPDQTTRLTRRQLLRSAGLAAAGLTVAGLAERTVGGWLPGTAGPPRTPHWQSRPDLRIPALTVLQRERGISADPIFIAPYNAPAAQAGAVIVGNDGQPIWENPLAEKVTTNFRVQRYRDSPVLTWWEGLIELGHRVGEYVIADAAYRSVRRIQASHGLRGDLHEFVLTSRGTALLTSYVVTQADLSGGGDRERAPCRTRSSRRSTSPAAAPAPMAQPAPHRLRGVLRARDRGLGLLSHQLGRPRQRREPARLLAQHPHRLQDRPDRRDRLATGRQAQ